jgi:predicted MPP superfamily phosphohydrolase
VKLSHISRRKFIAATLLAMPAVLVADAKFIEPTRLKVRHRRIGSGRGKPTHRLVHFTDLHHKGDRDYLKTVVDTINSLAPDFVCFTGDLVEEQKHLAEALAGLSAIQSPLFGVPGNHDYWSRISFAPVHTCFNATGGAWMLNENREIAAGKINLIGITSGWSFQQRLPRTQLTLNSAMKNILLMHYPAWAKDLGTQKVDLLLAGHSHGGQVRIPFYGALVTPFGVDDYDMGYFDTPAGPLYVNPGIGYLSNYNIRFNCRPEITVIEI